MATRVALREGSKWIHGHAFFTHRGVFSAGRIYPLITPDPDTRIVPHLGMLENSRVPTSDLCEDKGLWLSSIYICIDNMYS